MAIPPVDVERVFVLDASFLPVVLCIIDIHGERLLELGNGIAIVIGG